jgi:hypothetical protein
LQHLLFATTRVRLEQGGALKVRRQLAKQAVLFLPARRPGLALATSLYLDQRRRVEAYPFQPVLQMYSPWPGVAGETNPVCSRWPEVPLKQQ